MTPCLQIESLTKSFGDLVLFENFSLGIGEGQRVGLIAKNGTGKTTLLNILAGEEDYDSGTITFRRDLKVAYLEQDPKFPTGTTVLEACFHHGNSTVEPIMNGPCSGAGCRTTTTIHCKRRSRKWTGSMPGPMNHGSSRFSRG